RVHLFESKDTNRVIATIEVPGLRKDEVQLVARDNQLFISGERRPLAYSDDLGRTLVNELKFGRFERAIPLPPGTEPSSISASMDDGMLTVSWP
ncbi:HSP20-like chaperone, partial [Schizopora paradoxa]